MRRGAPVARARRSTIGTRLAAAQRVHPSVHVEHELPVRRGRAAGCRKGVEKEWDLGQGATLDLSELVMVDGNLTSMPVGYPKLEVKGSKQLYTFRFPRFKESVLYESVVSFNPDAFDDSSARSYGLVGSAAYVTGMIICILF